MVYSFTWYPWLRLISHVYKWFASYKLDPYFSIEADEEYIRQIRVDLTIS